MKESTAKIFKMVSHISLFIISDLLTISLFVQFSDDPKIQVIWVLFANALEMLKIYLFLMVKHHFTSTGKHQKLIATGLFVVYFGLAFVSAVASLNFTLLSIENQSFQSSQNNASIEMYQKEIDQIDDDLELVNSQIRSQIEKSNDTPTLYIKVRERIETAITNLEEEKKELLKRRSELIKKKAEDSKEMSVVSVDSFSLMGKKVGMAGKDVMFYIMGILILLLEVSLAITSGDVRGKVQVSENRGKLVKYVKALTDVNGIRLNSDKKISEMTGLSIKDCKYYKALLQEWKFNGIELVSSGRGGSRANFTTNQLVKIITARTKMGM